MSIRTMTAVWDSGRYASGTLLVLLAMADYADENHECWPSVRALAARARLSERQVARVLRDLRNDGAISPIGARPSAQGSPIVVYRINVDVLLKGDTHVTLRHAKGDKMSPLDPAKGDILSPLDPAKGDILSPLDPRRVTSMSPLDPRRVTSMSDDPPMIRNDQGRDDDDFQYGGGEGGNSLPDAIVAAWQWPLTAQARAFLRNAIAAYSAEEVLRAIDIAANQRTRIERPAAYIKRVLTARMSALADAAPPTPIPPSAPPPAPTEPPATALVRSALAEALPALADVVPAWPIRIDGNTVLIVAGHRAQWIAERGRTRVEQTLSAYLQKPIVVEFQEGI